MNRYNNTSIIFDRNGKRKLASTILNDIPVSQNDIYIQTTSAERLDNLAYTFYKDATLWWVIASVNSIKLGTIIVYPNTILRIPNPETIGFFIPKSSKIR